MADWASCRWNTEKNCTLEWWWTYRIQDSWWGCGQRKNLVQDRKQWIGHYSSTTMLSCWSTIHIYWECALHTTHTGFTRFIQHISSLEPPTTQELKECVETLNPLIHTRVRAQDRKRLFCRLKNYTHKVQIKAKFSKLPAWLGRTQIRTLLISRLLDHRRHESHWKHTTTTEVNAVFPGPVSRTNQPTHQPTHPHTRRRPAKKCSEVDWQQLPMAENNIPSPRPARQAINCWWTPLTS